jgi:hypothetical protein
MCEESQHDVTALGSYPQPFKKVTESDICCVIAFALIQPKQLVRAEDEGFILSILGNSPFLGERFINSHLSRKSAFGNSLEFSL